TDGVLYAMQAQAFDAAGNTSLLAYSSFTFTVSSPTAFVLIPSSAYVAGLPTISGTASAVNGGIVNNVQIAVKRLSDNKWFDGTNFNNAGVTFRPNAGLAGSAPSGWTYTEV